jgi:S-adenosyl-L-methionine methyltransferase
VSRLDINIRRLLAQRACLDAMAAHIRELPGPVFEMGLGNGRTYDHLREILPGREIFVFDREVAAHPECIPDPAHLFLGDFKETLPRATERFAGTVALIHADIGSADTERDARLARAVAEFLPKLLRPGGLVVSDRDVVFTGARPVPAPDDVAAGVYFLYRLEPSGRDSGVTGPG